jgi:N-acetylglutamate synthase/N-acetylornithine aminotransferase
VEDGETSTETNTCTRNSTGIIGLRLPGSPITLEVEEVEGIGITEVGGEN